MARLQLRRFGATLLAVLFVVSTRFATAFLTNDGVASEQSDAGVASEFVISEEQPGNTLVGSIKDNPRLRSQFTNDTLEQLSFTLRSPVTSRMSPAEFFAVGEQTGEIRTKKPIDRERICSPADRTCKMTFDVAVKPKQYFQIVRVRVTVDDVNDNAPRFAGSRISLSIKESTPVGTSFRIQSAVDDDSGTNGVQKYSLREDSDLFQLVVGRQVDGTLGVQLQLTGKLDRETAAGHSLTVVAVDGGDPPRSGTVEVVIDVVDSNDNAPQFQSGTYEVEVPENFMPTAAILRLKATDVDGGLNGAVTYALDDFSAAAYGDLFSVDANTGDVTLRRELDYEAENVYRLTVVATDRGHERLSSFARLVVNVTDVNDNPPHVRVSAAGSDAIEVPENADSGTFVAYVTASDVDTGSNGVVDCRVEQGSRFRLELVYGSGHSEYKLLTAATFDREAEPEVSATIRCSDRGTPPLTVATEVVVTVVDENDNVPYFGVDRYVVQMHEGNAVGTHVVRINATDADAGPNARLSYSMTSTSASQRSRDLSIDEKTGIVVAEVSFDYETCRLYEYIVTVADSGAVRRSATVDLVLHVVDVNDEPPRFDRPSYYFTVSENVPPGTSVGRVLAVDADVTDAFSVVAYSVVADVDSDQLVPFDVDRRTGQLTTSGHLDRESAAVYRFDVAATDSTHSSAASVTVYVDDQNDNSPTFRSPSPIVVVASRDSPVGTLLTRLDAVDPDEGRNAALTFAIANGNENGAFALDSVTGALSTAKQLTGPETVHRLVVTVHDGGQPSRFSVADVTLVFNSTAPPFHQTADGVATRSATSSAGFSFSDERFFIIFGMICGVVVVVVVASVFCCLFVARRSRRADDKKRAGHAPGDGESDPSRDDSRTCRSATPSERKSLTESWVAAGVCKVQTDESTSCAMDVDDDWVDEADAFDPKRRYERMIKEIRVNVRTPTSLPEMDVDPLDAPSLAAVGRCHHCHAPTLFSCSSPALRPGPGWRTVSSPDSVMLDVHRRRTPSARYSRTRNSSRRRTKTGADTDSELSVDGSCADSGLTPSDTASNTTMSPPHRVPSTAAVKKKRSSIRSQDRTNAVVLAVGSAADQ